MQGIMCFWIYIINVNYQSATVANCVNDVMLKEWSMLILILVSASEESYV